MKEEARGRRRRSRLFSTLHAFHHEHRPDSDFGRGSIALGALSPHAGAPGLLAPGEGRLLLHARSLRLRHPSRREGVEFSAGLPDDFLEGARRAGLLASAERVAGRDAVEWLGE